MARTDAEHQRELREAVDAYREKVKRVDRALLILLTFCISVLGIMYALA